MKYLSRYMVFVIMLLGLVSGKSETNCKDNDTDEFMNLFGLDFMKIECNEVLITWDYNDYYYLEDRIRDSCVEFHFEAFPGYHISKLLYFLYEDIKNIEANVSNAFISNKREGNSIHVLADYHPQKYFSNNREWADTNSLYYFELIDTNNFIQIDMYYNNGVKGLEVKYDSLMVRINEMKEWYPNGILKSTIHYNNGKLNGPMQWYYENGKIKLEANFKEGNRHGKWKHYGTDGNIIAEGSYNNGELTYIKQLEKVD